MDEYELSAFAAMQYAENAADLDAIKYGADDDYADDAWNNSDGHGE